MIAKLVVAIIVNISDKYQNDKDGRIYANNTHEITFLTNDDDS